MNNDAHVRIHPPATSNPSRTPVTRESLDNSLKAREFWSNRIIGIQQPSLSIAVRNSLYKSGEGVEPSVLRQYEHTDFSKFTYKKGKIYLL